MLRFSLMSKVLLDNFYVSTFILPFYSWQNLLRTNPVLFVNNNQYTKLLKIYWLNMKWVPVLDLPITWPISNHNLSSVLRRKTLQYNAHFETVRNSYNPRWGIPPALFCLYCWSQYALNQVYRPHRLMFWRSFMVSSPFL